MPIYEYSCPACKKSYELRQGFDAETTHTCEECGKGIAKRVLHAPPVVFKGSGWYATDSRNKSTAITDSDASGGDGGDSNAGDSASASSSDASTEAAAAG